MKTKRFLIAVGAIVTVGLSGTVAAGAQSTSVPPPGDVGWQLRSELLSQDELQTIPLPLQEHIEERRILGLPAEPAYVATLLETEHRPEDGYLMTASERADFDEWSRHSLATEDALLPHAQKLPGFGGAYWDHIGGGDLVLNFSDDSFSDAVEILSSLAQASGVHEYRIDRVSHTMDELLVAMHESWDLLREIDFSPELVGVDDVSNSIRLDYLVGTRDRAEAAAAHLQRELGVRVGVAPTTQRLSRKFVQRVGGRGHRVRRRRRSRL